MLLEERALKERLVAARRSHFKVEITDKVRQCIQNCREEGISNKAMCQVFGLSYSELKRIK